MPTDNRDSSGRLTRFITKQGKGVLITRLWKADASGARVYSDEWTRRVVRNGRQYYFTLGSDRATAEQTANDLDAFLQVRSNTIEQALQRFCPDKFAGRSVAEKVATIGEVIKCYQKNESVLDVKHSSSRRYCGCLVRMVATVRAQRSPAKLESGVRMSDKRHDAVLELPVTALEEHDFFPRFKRAMLGAADDDKAATKQRKRTVNGYLRNTRALFTKDARRHFKAAGLNVPELKALGDEPLFRKIDKKYSLPEVRVINRMFDLGRELKVGRPAAPGQKEIPPDLNAYAVYLLALHGGLRQQEIAHCRLTWFSETAPWRIRIQADGRFDPKGTEGETEIESWVHDELMALPKAAEEECMAAKEAGRQSDYLLRGNPNERINLVYRRLNKRLRHAGMNRMKPTHELRKLFGSYVASTRGLFVAQKFLRHRSAQLTSDDYADNVPDELVLARWKVFAA